MACNKNKYRPSNEVIKEKVNLGFKKFNNRGMNSQIINK